MDVYKSSFTIYMTQWFIERMKYWLFICLSLGNAGVVYGNMCCQGLYLSKVIPLGSQCPPPAPLYASTNTYDACSTSCCTARCASITSSYTIPRTTQPGFITGCSPTNDSTSIYPIISTTMTTFQAAQLNLTCMLECIPFTLSNTSITVIPTTTPLTTSVIPATNTAMTQCCTGFFASDTIPANSTCPQKSSIGQPQFDYSNCAQSCCLTHCLYSDQNQSNTSFIISSCQNNGTIFMQGISAANSGWKQNNVTVACSIECDKFKYQILNSGNDKTGLEIKSLAAPNSTKDKLFITIIMTLVTLFSFLY